MSISLTRFALIIIFLLSGSLSAENELEPFEMIRSSINSMTLGLGDDEIDYSLINVEDQTFDKVVRQSIIEVLPEDGGPVII